MGVEADVSVAVEKTDRLYSALADSKRRSMRYGASLLRKDQATAFARQADPVTNTPWAKRTEDYSWPLMWKTGELMRSVTASFGIKTRDGKPKLFGKLNSSDKRLSIRAGALHFGRSNSQSRWAGYRARKRAKHGVSGPGTMPPRPFFGMSRSSQQKFSRFWQAQIKAAQS